MGALKGFVVGMGVLIVIGMSLLAYGLYHKANNPDFKLFATSDDSPAFGDVAVPAPKGCVIADSQALDGRLYIRLGASDRLSSRLGLENTPNCDRILVVDAANGAVLGSISLKEAP